MTALSRSRRARLALTTLTATALAAAPRAGHAQGVNYWGSAASAFSVNHGGGYARSAEAFVSSAAGQASASGGLASASVHAAVFSSGDGVPGCYWYESAQCTWGGRASVDLWEYVTITPSKPGQTVSWSFDLDGQGGHGPHGNYGWYDGTVSYYFGRTYRDRAYATPVSRDGSPMAFRGSEQIDAPTTFYFYMGIDLGAYNGGYADYGNTLKFSWALPEGATFTSSSGEFMSAVPAAVTTPEPATNALLGAGVAALAGLVRFRRRVG